MNRYKKSRLIMTISFLLLISLSSLFFTVYQGVQIPYVTSGVRQIFASVDSVIAKPVQFVSGEKDELLHLISAYKENKELKETIAQLESKVAENEALIAENESLRQALQIDSMDVNQDTVSALVAVRTPNAWNQKLIVDVGTNSGVKENMFAVANGGLIGVVSSVNDDATTVRLLTNSDDFSKIAVKISMDSGNIYGILNGYDTDSHSFIVSQLNENVEVKPGSAVVTSDLAGNYPANIQVGTVSSVKNRSNNLDRELFVKPAANFSNIYVVSMIGK